MKAVAALALVIAALVPSLRATVVVFNLNTEFSGGTSPQGSIPWITATINDTADPGGAASVRVTISAANLTAIEFISELSLNLNPALNPANLTFAIVGTDPTGGNTVFQTGTNAFQADGDGNYDILFNFPPPPGTFASKFTTGESMVVDITISSGTLSATDFVYIDSGGTKGEFFAAAHIQGIAAPTTEDPNATASGWIGANNGTIDGAPIVPEPSTYAAIFSLLTGAIVIGRRFRKKAA